MSNLDRDVHVDKVNTDDTALAICEIVYGVFPAIVMGAGPIKLYCHPDQTELIKNIAQKFQYNVTVGAAEGTDPNIIPVTLVSKTPFILNNAL